MPKMASRLKNIKAVPSEVSEKHVKTAETPTEPITKAPDPKVTKKSEKPPTKIETSTHNLEKTTSYAFDIEVPNSWIAKVAPIAETYNDDPEEVLRKMAIKTTSELRSIIASGKIHDLEGAGLDRNERLKKISLRTNIRPSEYQQVQQHVDPLELQSKRQNLSEVYQRLLAIAIKKLKKD